MRTNLTFLMIITLLSLNTFAQKWSSANSNNRPLNNIEILKSSDNEIILDVNVNAYNLKDIETHNGNGLIVESADASSLQIKGAPDLPKISKSLMISNDKKMNVEYFDQEYIEIQNLDILPSKGAITTFRK